MSNFLIPKKYIFTFIIILFTSSSAFAQGDGIATNTFNRRVQRVIDVSTLELADGQVVKLIGVSSSMDIEGEATKFVKDLIEGKEVTVELDVQKKDIGGRLLAYVKYESLVLPDDSEKCKNQTLEPEKNKDRAMGVIHGDYFSIFNFETRDGCRYGISDSFLNAEIIGEGYAVPMITPPNEAYTEWFKELSQEARENKRGMWAHELAITTSEKALFVFREYWEAVVPEISKQPTRTIAEEFNERVKPEQNQIAAYLKPCLNGYKLVNDTLTEEEQKMMILYGKISHLDRNGDCWEVESFGSSQNELRAYIAPENSELVFIWVVPEG